VKSFTTIGRETTDPQGIENLITTRRTRTGRKMLVATGDPVSGPKIKTHKNEHVDKLKYAGHQQ